MPIRPENRDRYPTNWDDISRSIKERAQWRCECTGECGRTTHTGRCPNAHGQPAYGTGSTVILTTAHLDHIPENSHPNNLKAFCQGCHLHYDADHHAHTRATTRHAALQAAGQLTFTPHDEPTASRYESTREIIGLFIAWHSQELMRERRATTPNTARMEQLKRDRLAAVTEQQALDATDSSEVARLATHYTHRYREITGSSSLRRRS